MTWYKINYHVNGFDLFWDILYYAMLEIHKCTGHPSPGERDVKSIVFQTIVLKPNKKISRILIEEFKDHCF